MSSENERSAHFWKALAELALKEAERTLDADTQAALRSIAREYFELAQQIDAKASRSREPAGKDE